MELAVELRAIVKTYPETGLRANDSVDLQLRKQEILCLAGENGAGKTTLMKVLYGLEHADSGTISMGGKVRRIASPVDANRLGIGMVHQHFMLVDEFTVAQNVVLGSEPRMWAFAYDSRKAERLVDSVIQKHRFSIRADAVVGSLTVGQKQQVEIVKMLFRKVDILILDEPTAVLTEQETETLFVTLRALAEGGTSIILITHKLQEIMAVSDRVAIMRQGSMLGEFDTKAVSEREISRLMMGQSVSLNVIKKPYTKDKRPVVEFDSVSVVKRNQQRPMLDNLTFTAYSGEILGFAGVGGNGMGVLEAVLGGFLPVSSGSIRHNGTEITKSDTFGVRRNGLAYIPADRLKVGSALEATVAENIIVASRKEFSRYGFLEKRDMEQHAKALMQTFSIQGESKVPIGTLSGGNIQKVILAREIEQFRDYIVCCEPTWGLDIASSKFVYERILALRDQGAAVLLISSNLDEIRALSDRIAVMYRGSISALLSSEDAQRATKEELGAYMLGISVQEELHG